LTGFTKLNRIKSMKILVTGGTGFIGSHLIDQLLIDQPSAEILALVRNPAHPRWLKTCQQIHIIEGGLVDPPALPGDIQTVYHLAGLTKAARTSDYYTVNKEGTARLFRRLAESGSLPRVIYLSSVSAGGPGTVQKPHKESDPARPVSDYGKSKLEAEKVALSFKGTFHVTILRPGAIYGPRDDDFLDYFRWVKRGLVPVFGWQKRYLSACHVRDMVRAAILAAGADSPSGKIFNIAHAVPCSWEQIGWTAARILGRKAFRMRIPCWAAFFFAAAGQAACRFGRSPTAVNISKFRDMEAPGWVVDVQEARRSLRFEASISLEEGLAETLDWYQKNDLL